MHIFDNIQALLKNKRKTQKELCKYLGLRGQAFTDWKSGKSESYMRYLPQIAEYFDVSVDFLLGKEHEDSRRDKLIAWIYTLSDAELDRAETLLRAANLLPDTF